MTEQHMDDILDRLRRGEEFSVRNHEGVWGIRFHAGRFIQWGRYAYEERTETEISADEIRTQLGDWAYQRVRAQMSPPA